MNATLEKKLAGLKHYVTRYELVAENGASRVLIGYSSRKSRHGIVSMLRQRLTDKTFYRLFTTNEMHVRRVASHGVDIGDYLVRFTGRTEREAMIGGELPFIGDLPATQMAEDDAA